MSSVLLLKVNSVGGKEVPVLTVCNLLLSLILLSIFSGELENGNISRTHFPVSS